MNTMYYGKNPGNYLLPGYVAMNISTLAGECIFAEVRFQRFQYQGNAVFLEKLS